MTLKDYLARRRMFEIALAVGLVGLGCVANAIVVWVDYGRSGRPFPAELPWILEGTSPLALLLLIPLVLWFDRRFPLARATWRRAVPAHALFSVVFALAHVGLFYWFRKVAYAVTFADTRYYWEHWLLEFGYEYLKDFRTYMLVLAVIYLYRFIIVRLQGEAGFVAEDHGEEPDPAMSPAVADRLLVKKLGREFLVRVDDIDWIESCGNYVNLHVGDKVYPLRDTMTNIADRFEPRGFRRVHRRAIVNLDRVAEIQVFDTGDGEIRLTTASTVPVSRRFRKALALEAG